MSDYDQNRLFSRRTADWLALCDFRNHGVSFGGLADPTKLPRIAPVQSRTMAQSQFGRVTQTSGLLYRRFSTCQARGSDGVNIFLQKYCFPPGPSFPEHCRPAGLRYSRPDVCVTTANPES